MNENQKIKEWYLKEFPTDELGNELKDDITFQDIFDALDNYKDFYKVIGVSDSIVRERCFGKLCEVMHCDYDYIYDQWLLGE